MNQRDLPGLRVFHQQAYEDLQAAWEDARRARDYASADAAEREAKQYIARYGPIFARANVQRMLDENASRSVRMSSDKYPFMPVPSVFPVTERRTASPLPAPRRQDENLPVYQTQEINTPRRTADTTPQPPPHPGERPTFASSADDTREKTKYQYVYGLKDLRIGHAQYEDSAVLVSEPMSIKGNVVEITLDAFEDHPILRSNSTTRHTDIEYAVSFVDNPTPSDWHPVLPQQADRIQNERLLFQTARTAELRFPARATSTPMPVVYKNNKPMGSRDWALTDGGRKLQLLTDYDPDATYAIAYHVNENVANPWAIDIPQLAPERIERTDRFPRGASSNKTVQLSRYPFVDYEQIDEDFDPNDGSYQPLRVTLEDAAIHGPDRTTLSRVRPEDSGDDIVTRNITDYVDHEWAQPSPYQLDDDDRHLVFEYAQANDKLYFSETFRPTDLFENAQTNHGSATIRVDYETLVSDFRIKVIFRNNHHTNAGVTPRLENFRLHFHVME